MSESETVPVSEAGALALSQALKNEIDDLSKQIRERRDIDGARRYLEDLCTFKKIIPLPEYCVELLHEAAHGVVGAVMGLNVERVCVAPWLKGYRQQQTDLAGSCPPDVMVAWWLSGYAFLSAVIGCPHDWREVRARVDLKHALKEGRQLMGADKDALESYVDRVWLEARAHSYEHRRAVFTLAAELFDEWQVDGQRVAEIVAREPCEKAEISVDEVLEEAERLLKGVD